MNAYIMVTGGRDAKDYNQVARQLGIAIKDLTDKGNRNITVLTGSAIGAGGMAIEFCNKVETSLAARGIDLRTKPYYAAYSRRGEEETVDLLDPTRDIMLAFPTPSSKNVWSTVKYAKSKGISPRIFKEL